MDLTTAGLARQRAPASQNSTMSQPTGIVRPATAADGAACAEIYAHYVRATAITFETEPPDAAAMAARIADYSATHAWLVQERSGQVTGYAYGHRFAPRAAYDWSCETSIYVAPEACGTGAGRALYQALLPALAGRGYRRAFAGVALPNPASLAIHQRFGFRQVGVFEAVGWKLGRWHDVAWLQLDLVDDDAGQPPVRVR